MARSQYRYFGQLYWQSMSGNAMLAIANGLSSGKKIKVQSLEVKSDIIGTISNFSRLSLMRGTSNPEDGDVCNLSPQDTEAVLPSGIQVVKNSSFVPSSTPFMSSDMIQTSNGTGSSLSQKFFYSSLRGSGNDLFYHNTRKSYGVENITVNPGEAVGIFCSGISTRNQILMARYTILVSGSPKRTWIGSTVLQVNPNSAALVFRNESVSDVFEIKSIALSYLGTDTTYLQVVPIGKIDPNALGDLSRNVPLLKMDTDHDNLSSNIKVLQDVPMLPLGVPENALSNASTLTPKGYNYLHTKDFTGPQYSVMFPEHTGKAVPNGSFDARLVGTSGKNHNLLSKGAPIVLNPGEGLAIVSGAESAASGQVGTAGWQALNFGLVFSVESFLSLTLTNLVNGSDVVILEAGTETVLEQSDQVSSGSYQYSYDAPTNIDIFVIKQGYIPLYIRNYPLGSVSGTIPISQIVDRNFIS